MRNSNLFRLALACATGLLLQAGSAAHANVIFDWTGTCQICSGTATAVLTLTNAYMPGTLFDNADFVSFQYTSSQGTFTDSSSSVTLLNGFNADGSLVAPLSVAEVYDASANPGAALLGFYGGQFPSWTVFSPSVTNPPSVTESGYFHDYGTAWTVSLVTQTPEPAAIAVFATGLFGFGFMRRRRKNTAG